MGNYNCRSSLSNSNNGLPGREGFGQKLPQQWLASQQLPDSRCTTITSKNSNPDNVPPENSHQALLELRIRLAAASSKHQAGWIVSEPTNNQLTVQPLGCSVTQKGNDFEYKLSIPLAEKDGLAMVEASRSGALEINSTSVSDILQLVKAAAQLGGCQVKLNLATTRYLSEQRKQHPEDRRFNDIEEHLSTIDKSSQNETPKSKGLNRGG